MPKHGCPGSDLELPHSRETLEIEIGILSPDFTGDRGRKESGDGETVEGNKTDKLS
jgi:hypothetical protein